MQHNSWKLKTSIKYFCKIVLWLLAGAIAVNFICNFSYFDLASIPTLVSLVSIIASIFWWLLEKILWKNRIVNSLLGKTNFKTPVLLGRWEGMLRRDKEEHPFVVEITQSFTTIFVKTFSKHSSSSSICSELLLDEQGTFRLVYTWQGRTSNTSDDSDNTNDFYGTTIFNIINPDYPKEDCLQLSGEYYTGRQPYQTMGYIIVKYKQKDIKNCF